MKEEIRNLIKMALAEDIGSGDITSNAVVPKGQRARAVIVAKESGVIAGLPVAQLVFEVLDRKVKFSPKAKDGHAVGKNTVIAHLSGPARSILAGERLALNFLQRMSGIATLTRNFKIQTSCPSGRRANFKTKILDTRKTVPLWRSADKYAVLAGGGRNHRFGLFDAVLIKDNHIKLAGGIKKSIVVVRQRRTLPNKPIEVEAKTLSEVKQAIVAGADRILLDNMGLKTLRAAVRLCKKAGIETEASGGVNLKNVRQIAKTGVDYISIGALTHSATAMDISLKII